MASLAVALAVSAAFVTPPMCQPRARDTRSHSPISYDGGPAPTSDHAVLNDNAPEAEEGAMLLVRYRSPTHLALFNAIGLTR